MEKESENCDEKMVILNPASVQTFRYITGNRFHTVIFFSRIQAYKL